jgi:hypothetical protein
MTSQGYFRLIILILAGMIGYWYFHKDDQAEELQKPAEAHQVSIPAKKEAKPEPQTTANPENSKPADPNATPASESFMQALEKMHACLGTPKGDLPKQPILSTFIDYLQARSGETVFNSEEWRNTFLVLPNGEKRHIRIEYDMGENEEYVKKLKYFTVGPDNNLVPLPISPEHSDNPTDLFVDSLEKEGEVTMTEKANRMYFKDGTELYSVERDGQIKEIELNKEGKLFRCLQMNTPNQTCECM